jgi:hypothetical protein
MSRPHMANDHEGGIICSVDPLGVELARLTSLYQLDGILIAQYLAQTLGPRTLPCCW